MSICFFALIAKAKGRVRLFAASLFSTLLAVSIITLIGAISISVFKKTGKMSPDFSISMANQLSPLYISNN